MKRGTGHGVHGVPGEGLRVHVGHRRAERLRDASVDVLDFGRWYVRNPYRLMRRFASDLGRARDAAALQSDLLRTLARAERVLAARLVVTVLLALGVVATTAGAILSRVWVPELYAGDVARSVGALETLAAIAAPLSLLFLVARLAFDRYLRLVETCATMLSIELASARVAQRSVMTRSEP